MAEDYAIRVNHVSKVYKLYDKPMDQNACDIYLTQGMDKKSAMKQVAADRGIPKREVYNSLLND